MSSPAPGQPARRCARAGTICRSQRDDRSGRRPRSWREKPSISRQSRRRRTIPARRELRAAFQHPARLAPPAALSRCAARESPPATTCWRSNTPALQARGCMPARGANGSAILAGQSPQARTRVARLWRLLANPIAIVRANVAAEPNSSSANAADALARRSERPIAWSIDDSAELYQVNAWGKGYFCVNPAGHLVVRPDMNARARDRPVRGRAGPERARTHHARGGAILRHPRAPAQTSARRVRAGDRRERVPEPLHRGVPDQGEPAASRGRRGVSLRPAVRLRPGSGQQARTAVGHDHDGGLAGTAHRLQRLQGRQLPRGGDHRHQARPHHHPGGREFQRACRRSSSTPRNTTCGRASVCA